MTVTINGALVAALGELTNPVKDKTANLGGYSYRYADLATIIDHVRPVLAKHDLAVTQNVTVEEGKLEVWTYIHHASGEVLTYGAIVGRAGSSWQELGSAVTYARRYALAAALGIAPDEDTDANTVTPTPPASKVEKVKVTSPPEDDPWYTPKEDTTRPAAAVIEEMLGGIDVTGSLPGDILNGKARGNYDNAKKGVSDKQKYVIVTKLKKAYPDFVVDEDTALLQAVTVLLQAGDAEPNEVNDWQDMTRRMIDRLFNLGGVK